MKKMLFIYNPNAGTGKLKPKLADVLDIFTKSGYEVTVYPTQKRYDAAEKIQESGSQYDLIVCSGGDGTLDEAVTGMQLCNCKFRWDISRRGRRMILRQVSASRKIFLRRRRRR